MIAKKKKSTNNDKCYFCSENHSIHKRKTFKESNPDVDVFKNKHGNKSESNSFASFVPTFFTSTDELKDDWFFDSGSSIYVCNDSSRFEEMLSWEELTVIASKVSIRGIGKVKVDDITLNKVAFVPDMDFKLMSVSVATCQSVPILFLLMILYLLSILVKEC